MDLDINSLFDVRIGHLALIFKPRITVISQNTFFRLVCWALLLKLPTGDISFTQGTFSLYKTFVAFEFWILSLFTFSQHFGQNLLQFFYFRVFIFNCLLPLFTRLCGIENFSGILQDHFILNMILKRREGIYFVLISMSYGVQLSAKILSFNKSKTECGSALIFIRSGIRPRTFARFLARLFINTLFRSCVGPRSREPRSLSRSSCSSLYAVREVLLH